MRQATFAYSCRAERGCREREPLGTFVILPVTEA